jgi:hypothetical protein
VESGLASKSPRKAADVAWWASTNSLAVKEGLHRRISTVDPTCAICGLEPEDDRSSCHCTSMYPGSCSQGY